MAVPGALFGSLIGPNEMYDSVATGANTYAMASLNVGWAARFVATQGKDIKSVKVNFSVVTAAGTVTLRIETIDGTTGKPSGTLYDANATKAFTPVAGWQTVTFDSIPTTNLTAGTQYAIVLLTTTGGTTMTLRSYLARAVIPIVVLTAADGTTRSNFAEVTNSLPILSLILDDDSEDPMGFAPFATATTNNIFSTNGISLKLTLLSTVVLAGVEGFFVKAGTPAGDLRVRVFTSADSVVSNSTVTVDKDSSVGQGSQKKWPFWFPGLLTLAAGTYRIVFDSASSADSSNCWRLFGAIPVTTTVAPSGFVASTCPDVGTPVWTDSATADQLGVRAILDSIPAPSGGSANLFAGKL